MRAVAVILMLLAGPVAAADPLALALPANARLVYDELRPETAYDLPIGAFAGTLPVAAREGQMTLRVWQIAAEMATLRVLAPLRDQLAAAGFTTIFACRDTGCGGYDFRYATTIAPPPEMQVDLTDYHYLAVARDDERVSVLVSRAGSMAFVQVIHIGPTGSPAPQTTAQAAPAVVAPGDQSVTGQLLATGRVVLADLTFATGATDLGPGPFGTLDALARFLAEDAARRVALVGHTDATGSLDGNIALSERRAVAVLERLVTQHGVARAQIEARGIGYLAPLFPNTTPEGREQNRRVEAVLLTGG